METNKNTTCTACLEITSTFAKFAIGSVVNSQPVLVYYAEKPIRGCLKDGMIQDGVTIEKTLASFLNVQDESLKLKINATNISMILPPLGLKVYQSDTSTNVVASTDLIDRIDITNVMSLVNKESIPNGNALVDIIPDLYITDNGKAYANPPLGVKSHALGVRAKIQTLPSDVVYSYRTTVEHAGFRTSRMAVASYCASQLIACTSGMPESYLLVDIGAHLTSVSLVGLKTLITSLAFPKGGDDLTEAVASTFEIPFANAERIKIDNGYDERKTLYRSPLASSQDETGKTNTFYQADLNNVILSFIESYDLLLSNAINQTIERQPNKNDLYSLPVVFTGGGSSLNGLSKLLSKALGSHPAIFFTPRVMGGRSPRLTNLLGLIVAQGEFRGSLQDNYHGVGSLSRDR